MFQLAKHLVFALPLFSGIFVVVFFFSFFSSLERAMSEDDGGTMMIQNYVLYLTAYTAAQCSLCSSNNLFVQHPGQRRTNGLSREPQCQPVIECPHALLSNHLAHGLESISVLVRL